MKNMFNVTTVLPHNLLQTNPCIRHNFSTQVFRKRAAQLHYVGPELRYIFQPMRINSVPDVKCFLIIKMCYVHNQWYDISCATLYLIRFPACSLNIHYHIYKWTSLVNFPGKLKLNLQPQFFCFRSISIQVFGFKVNNVNINYLTKFYSYYLHMTRSRAFLFFLS